MVPDDEEPLAPPSEGSTSWIGWGTRRASHVALVARDASWCSRWCRATPATVVPGQVVRISGRGYPPADTIRLNVRGSPLEARTGPGGSFDLDVVVLQGFPTGPTTVDDVAEPDRFDAEIVDLLIELREVKPYGNSHVNQANRPRFQR